MKDLSKASYILGIRIYRDRSRGLLGLSQSTYIEKILKEFSINLSKKGFIPMVDGKHLSRFMCPETHKDREIMIGFHNWIDQGFYDMYTFRYSFF